MKKKLIVLVIDTELSNEQIEECEVYVTVSGVTCYHKNGDESIHNVDHDARNVRVIDVDEITGELETPKGISFSTVEKVMDMIPGHGTSRQALWGLLCHAVQKGNS